MAKFRELAVFTLQTDLAVVRSLLESEGIECFVRDELTTQVYTFSSAIIGGNRLDVLENDFDKAKAVIDSQGYSHFLSEIAEEKSPEDLRQEAQLINVLKWVIKIVIVLGILAILLFFFRAFNSSFFSS